MVTYMVIRACRNGVCRVEPIAFINCHSERRRNLSLAPRISRSARHDNIVRLAIVEVHVFNLFHFSEGVMADSARASVFRNVSGRERFWLIVLFAFPGFCPARQAPRQGRIPHSLKFEKHPIAAESRPAAIVSNSTALVHSEMGRSASEIPSQSTGAVLPWRWSVLRALPAIDSTAMPLPRYR